MKIGISKTINALEITFKDIDVIEEIEKKAVEEFMKKLGTKVFPRK